MIGKISNIKTEYALLQYELQLIKQFYDLELEAKSEDIFSAIAIKAKDTQLYDLYRKIESERMLTGLAFSVISGMAHGKRFS